MENLNPLDLPGRAIGPGLLQFNDPRALKKFLARCGPLVSCPFQFAMIVDLVSGDYSVDCRKLALYPERIGKEPSVVVPVAFRAYRSPVSIRDGAITSTMGNKWMP